jgi:hypothetical protein
MQSGTESRLVMLRGGFTVPMEPVLLLLALEARGVCLSRDGDELLVQPGTRLTDQDRIELRRWRWHLLALVDYVPPEVPGQWA